MKSPQPTDIELIAGVVRRDSAALEALFDRYAASALGIAVKILRDRPTAEEVLQEAFWRVWKSAASFDGTRGAFSTWLFGIVRHLAIDELRRRAARPSGAGREVEGEAALEIPAESPEVADVVWTQLQHARVRAAIQQLPDAQRQVILLSYFQGLTREEIAAKLGEPPGTIHTRARLALQKLRGILAGQH